MQMAKYCNPKTAWTLLLSYYIVAIAIMLVCFEPVHAVSRPSSSTLQTFVLDQSALRTVPKWVQILSEPAEQGSNPLPVKTVRLKFASLVRLVTFCGRHLPLKIIMFDINSCIKINICSFLSTTGKKSKIKNKENALRNNQHKWEFI